MPDEIFRFLFLRPPEPSTAVTVQPSKDFSKDLTTADVARDRRSALKVAASNLVSSARGIKRLDDLNLGNALAKLQAGLAKLDDPSLDELEDAIENAFGKSASAVVKAAE